MREDIAVVDQIYDLRNLQRDDAVQRLKHEAQAALALALAANPTGGGGGGYTTANFIDNEIPSGSINGSNTAFTLANSPNPSTSLHLYLNGVRLRPTIDYTLSGAAITMSIVPQTGDWLYADYRI